MNYWPGTKIVKSMGNAFNWKGQSSQITQQKDFIMSNTARLAMAGAASKGKVKSITLKDKK